MLPKEPNLIWDRFISFTYITLDHSAHSGLVFDSNGGGAVAGPGGGHAMGGCQHIFDSTCVLSTVHVADVLQLQILVFYSETFISNLGPEVGCRWRIGHGYTLNVDILTLIQFLINTNSMLTFIITGVISLQQH